MAIHDFFLNHFETSDEPSDRRLLSHYYNNDYQTTQNKISIAFQEYGLKLVNVDNTYNEMLFENRKIKLIVTLREISLYEIRVDLTINTSYLLPMKRGIKIVEQLYLALDKKLTLKYKGASNE